VIKIHVWIFLSNGVLICEVTCVVLLLKLLDRGLQVELSPRRVKLEELDCFIVLLFIVCECLCCIFISVNVYAFLNFLMQEHYYTNILLARSI
jgi:hypothetical protein